MVIRGLKIGIAASESRNLLVLKEDGLITIFMRIYTHDNYNTYWEIPPSSLKSIILYFLVLLFWKAILNSRSTFRLNPTQLWIMLFIKSNNTISYYFIYGVAVVLQIQSQHSRKNSSSTTLQTPQRFTQRAYSLLPTSKTTNLGLASLRIWSISLATPF